MSLLVNPFWHVVTGSNPLDIPDLQLWLDATQETGFSNGDEVFTAQDWSGNNRDATGVIGNVLRPTYRATDGPNSLPAFRLQNDATQEGGGFDLPNFLTSYTEGHHFTVVKCDLDPNSINSRSGPVLGDWGTALLGEFFGFPADGKIYSFFGSNTRHTTVDPAAALNVWGVYEERSAANAWSNWWNGVQLDAKVVNTVAWGTTPKIGYRITSGTATLYGMFQQSLFFSRVLNAGEITTVYDYIEGVTTISLP